MADGHHRYFLFGHTERRPEDSRKARKLRILTRQSGAGVLIGLRKALRWFSPAYPVGNSGAVNV